MKTRRLHVLSLITFLIAIGLTDLSFAFRCGTELVDEGDTKYEVLHKCGDPSHIESWEEDRFQTDFGLRREYDTHTGQPYWTRAPLLVKEKVKIEEWTYNTGPTEFIRYLRFENGILTNISTGDKGF
jgi:Protein of unknown function (DUF2845)